MKTTLSEVIVGDVVEPRSTNRKTGTVWAVPAVETAVAELAGTIPGTGSNLPAPRLEVADISEKTWDGVVVVWSTVFDEGKVRDAVLRSVLAQLPAALAAR